MIVLQTKANVFNTKLVLYPIGIEVKYNKNIYQIYKVIQEDIESGNKQKDTTLYLDTNLDVKPEYPGGNETFNAHVNIFLKKSINKKDSTVFMIFKVEKNGELSNIKIMRGIDAQTDEQTDKEIIEIVKNSPKWKPGEKEGQKVRCVMPFILTINGSK